MIWSEMILMVCIAVTFAVLTIAHADNTKVVLFGEGSEAGEIIEELERTSSAFDFERADSLETLEDMVRSGAAECGFIFEDGFEKFFSEGKEEGIIFASSPFTAKGFAAKETVFAVLMNRYAGDLLDREIGNIFKDREEAASLTEKLYGMIRHSDAVFNVKYESLAADGREDNEGHKADSFLVHGIIALLMLVFCLFCENENRFGKYRLFGRAFTPGERTVIFAEKNIASLTLPALAGFIVIRLLEPASSALTDSLLMIACVLYTTLWCSLFGKIFKREEGYICWSLLIFISSFIITPVLWSPAEYLPVLDKISCVLPNGAYLKLLDLIINLT